MEDGDAGRDGQGVRGDQTRQREIRRGECRRACAVRERDGETRQQEGRAEEPEPRSGAFAEVLGRQSAMDARADRADDDDEVALEAGGLHLTTTSPLMS